MGALPAKKEKKKWERHIVRGFKRSIKQLKVRNSGKKCWGEKVRMGLPPSPDRRAPRSTEGRKDEKGGYMTPMGGETF